jgi:hypothetical protein
MHEQDEIEHEDIGLEMIPSGSHSNENQGQSVLLAYDAFLDEVSNEPSCVKCEEASYIVPKFKMVT